MSLNEGAPEANHGWAQQLRRGLVTLEQLEERGWLDASPTDADLKIAKTALDVRVPVAFHDEINKGDASLIKQFIPSVLEARIAPEELGDPIGDETFSPVAGLTHRYPDRVLVKITYQCAVYCRFCFRRHKVSHSEENLSYEALNAAYNYIETHPEIKEVIFTGGDPLVLTDKKLLPHLERVERIEHVESIRFHTRVPVALPERITSELCETLSKLKKLPWMVIHTNSASELTDAARESIARLRQAGIPMAAQSVLLRGVNDSKESLELLFRSLFRLGVKPYYLHYPDLAKGTGHFRIPLSRAVEMISKLQGRLSGLAIPQLTVDIPGGHGKIPVNSNYCVLYLSEGKNSCEIWKMKSPTSGDWIEVQYPLCP
ncbi:KamA family radical SAM protein [bacterium]|nr:KamA family radical SAM protein [bacterium]